MDEIKYNNICFSIENQVETIYIYAFNEFTFNQYETKISYHVLQKLSDRLFEIDTLYSILTDGLRKDNETINNMLPPVFIIS